MRQDGFWNNAEAMSIEDPGAIRILVCGNSGIGKSTLINAVFGAEVVSTSHLYCVVRTRVCANLGNPLDNLIRPFAWNT